MKDTLNQKSAAYEQSERLLVHVNVYYNMQL